jgi:translation initiation factor IF-3
MFRGREVTHPERGVAILDRLADELSELGVVEQRPLQEGRNMTMMMAPSKAVLAGRVDVAEHSNGDAPEGAHMGDVASAAIESPAGGSQTSGVEEPGSVEVPGEDALNGESGGGEAPGGEAKEPVMTDSHAEDGGAPADPAVS